MENLDPKIEAQNQPQPQSQPVPPNPNNNQRVINIVLGVLVAMIIIGLGVYFLLKMNKAGDETPPMTEETGAIVEQISVDNQTNLSGWKTFRDEEFGFTINYPLTIARIDGSWIFERSGDTVFFGPNSSKSGGYVWNVTIYDQNERDIEVLIKEHKSPIRPEEESRENIFIGELPALLVTSQYQGLGSKSVYIRKDDKIYVIRGTLDDLEFTYFYSTFKFI